MEMTGALATTNADASKAESIAAAAGPNRRVEVVRLASSNRTTRRVSSDEKIAGIRIPLRACGVIAASFVSDAA